MRYVENTSVEKVLAWIAEQGVSIARRTYQDFITRVLHLMPLAQAKDLGVNPELLKAIRVRYKLPVDPRRARVVVDKKAPWHNHRQRRRPIHVGPKPKRVAAAKLAPVAPARPQKRDRLDANQFPLPGMVGLPPDAKQYPLMTGTPEKPAGYGDWKIINAMARDKLYALDRKVMPNYESGVIHIRTRKQYNPEELVALFNLTPNEAQSCYMSFDDVTTP